MKISDIRAKNPEWATLDDMQVVNVLHEVYYPDMDKAELAKAVGAEETKAPPAPRSMMRTAGDVGISALKGAIGVPEAAIGLLDIPTMGLAGKGAEAVGFRPKEAKAFLDEQYSDQQKGAFRAVNDANGFGGKFVAALQNPSVIGHSVVESLPAMGAGGVVGRGVLAAAPRLGAGLSAGVGEGVVGAGSAAEQIRQETPDGTLSGGQVGAAIATGVGTTAFSALGNKVAKSLGINDVDTMLVGAVATPAKAKGVVRRVLEGAASEGLLEELPQSVHEQVMQNLALGKPIDDGVDQAAVLGLLSGAAMGGGANVLHAGAGRPPAANDPVDTAMPAANDPLALPAPVINVGPDGTATTADQRNDILSDRAARAGQIVEKGGLSRAANLAMAAGDVVDVEVKPVGALARAAETVAPKPGDLNEGTSDEAPIDEGGQELPGARGVQLPVAATPIEQPALAGGLAQGDVAEGPPIGADQALELARNGGSAPAVDAAPEVFTTYDEADTFRKEQKARGATITALPVETEGGFKLAARGTPEYEQGEQLREDRRIAKERADAGVLDGDIANSKGLPFTIRLPANNAAKKAGPGHEVVAVKGGFVVRKSTTPTANAQPDPVRSAAPAGAPAVSAAPAAEPVAPAVAPGRDAAGARPSRDADAVPAKLTDRGEVVEHITGRGRTLRGVWRADLDKAAAEAIDPSTWAVKGKGFFIREQHLDALPPVAEAPAAPAKAPILEGKKIDAEWSAFAPESGTKGIPRVDMPQIKAEHRGAMVNFLAARDITHEEVDVPPASLKPTQAEFSKAKVEQARTYTGGDRSILVSADGHVLDGHHQWMAAMADGAPTVKAIRLDAPIARLMDEVKAFPSAEASQVVPAAAPAAPRAPAAPTAPAAPAAPGKRESKATVAAREAEEARAAYFAPGNIIKAYSGFDEVLAYTPGPDWSVKVAEVEKKGDEWVRVGKPQDSRTHRTQPDDRVLKGGPVGKVSGAAAYTEPRADGKAFPDAPSRSEPAAAALAPDANKIFTEDAAAAARARMKSKLGRLNSGIDPELLQDGITLAGYHIEKGARTFAAYAKAMLGDMGEGIRPYLKQLYMALKFDPRAGALEGLDTAAAVEAVDVNSIEAAAPAADTEESKDGNAARNLDRPSTGPLEGAPAKDDRTAGEGGRARAGADESRGRDRGGDSPASDAGRDLAGSVGTGARDLPVPTRGTGAAAEDAQKPRLPRPPRPGARADGLRPEQSGLTPPNGPNEAPNAPPIAAPQIKAEDFTIADDMALGEGGQKTKFKGNVAAIRLLNDLEAAGRLATPEEQRVLAGYVGWGGLPQAFDAKNADWSKEHAELTELLSPEDLAAARKSTRYAHYTSRPIVVDGIYAALRRFGFTGGKTLEAGAGVGNFLGLMPADMRSAGRFTAIEREPFSSAIAKHLYPRQIVLREDFTQYKGNDAYFDAAVGNPPFASDTQTDQSGRKHLSGLSLHNYFFAKAVDMLREGGVMAQVVTNSFLDARTDSARKYISDRTVFLGAIRLPNSAFAKKANTEVTTDIVFLQKRPDAEFGGKAARADAKRWLDIGRYTDKAGKVVALNQYFIDNPAMMLGDFGAFGTMYGPDQPALVARPGQDTLALLQAAVAKLPEGVYKSIAETNAASQTQAAIVALKSPTVQEGGFFNEGGKLMQRLPDLGGEARGAEITPATQWTEKTKLGDSGFARIKALADLRTTTRALIAAEMADDDKGMGRLRTTLNQQYDAYRKEHGLINDPSTLRVFDDDPDFPLLASLEHGYTPGIGPTAAKRQGVKPTKSTATKAPIFNRRVVAARTRVSKVDTPADALAVSMAERGRLDAAYIGQLLNRDAEDVLRELSSGDKPALFRDPASDEYVLRDAYLSGNVRAKLAQARAAGMAANARALEEVQPEDVSASQISARVGSPWVPESVYEDFAVKLFGEGTKARVRYLKINSSFAVDVKAGSDVANRTTWGTSDVPGTDLLTAMLNNRPIRVTAKDADGRTYVLQDRTDMANAKAQDMREAFGDWLFADGDRAEKLVRSYNDTNNNYVTRVYDGAMMEFPGKVPDEVIKFRRHQRDAIARGVQERTALLDHVVGSGKTFTVVATAMELKRTGLANKSMVAVPNHLVKQWAADFYRLYPGANILTATKKDFEKANRRKFLAKIATGDWDAVVIAHSSYGFIRPAPEFEAAFNAREVEQIAKTIRTVADGDGDGAQKKRTVKQLEALQEKLENRIKALRDKPMDDLLDFEQIGVDQLFVDEFHMFKNLMFSTKMQNVQGLGDSAGSQRAYDMLVKINQIFAKNGRDQGFIAATGTPVSNSLAEMYHMMRYLMPTAMKELGFESFDAWANTFASVEQVWMQKPSGDGYKASSRMSNFVNTPELLKMFDQVCDTVTMEDIKVAYREENGGAEFPLPKLKGDRRSPVSLDKTAAQESYMEALGERAKVLEARKGPPQKGEDNILVIMGDGRKAAMDIRLVDPDRTEREPGGRIDRSSDEILARYNQFNAVKGTQLVFSDLGTPIKHAKAELKEYEALRDRLAAATDDIRASAALGNEAAAGIVEDAEAAQDELDGKGPDWLGAVKAAERGFSVYDDLRAALIEKGIPGEEIAFIHDYNTDDQKAALFRKVNAGDIRVVVGSTPKMGAGTNVQERLVALHHLDVPWRPSDVEQREGRIIRQGNALMNQLPDFEVEILAYVTKDTLDMRMWQVQETKLKMINQLRTRAVGREIDNAFEDLELSAGEMQAAATGNIDLLHEIQLRADVKKLEQRKRSFDASRNELEARRRRNAERVDALPKKIEAGAGLAKQVEDYFTAAQARVEDFKATIDGKEYTDWREAQRALRAIDETKVKSMDKDGKEIERAAPISVEINGETYKARAAMAEAFSDIRGDVDPIVWAIGGEDYRRRTRIGSAIRQGVVDAIADQQVKPIGTIAGLDVAVEGSLDKGGQVSLEVTLSKDGVVVASNDQYVTDSGRAPENVVGAVSRMLSSIPSEHSWLTRQLDAAKKEQADLQKTEDAGAWPDAAKLEGARLRHKEVLGRLAGKPGTSGAASADAPAFSRGTGAGLTLPEVRNAVNVLTKGWANAPDIIIARDMDDTAVPEAVRLHNEGQKAQGAEGEPEGFFYRGKVYVIASQLSTPADVARVVFHESLGHFGLRGAFGDSLKPVLQQLAGLRRAEVEAKAKQYGLDTSVEAQRLMAAEEVLAEMAQANPQQGFVRRAIAAIRTWLRENLPALGALKLSDDEILRSYLLPARGWVQKGAQQAPARAAAEMPGQPAYSRTATAEGLNDTRDYRAKAKNAVSDLFSTPGAVSWWHKTVGTMHDLAQRSPQFNRVYDAVQTFLQDVSYYATEAADLAPRILPKLETLADLKKTALSAEDTKGLSRPVFEGTLLWGRDQAGKLIKMTELEAQFANVSTQEKGQMLLRKRAITPEQLQRWQASKLDIYEAAVTSRFDAEFLTPGVVFTDAELKSTFGASDLHIGLYREFRASVDMSLNRLGIAEMLRFGGKDTAALRDMVLDAPTANDAAVLLRDALLQMADDTPERGDVLRDTANKMIEKGDKIQSLIDRGYAPLTRYGQYTLDVVDENGERVYFGMFEGRLERGAKARQMRENFPKATITQGTNSQQAYKLFNGITPETLELFGNMVGLESDGDGESHQMFQQYLKLAKSNRSAMKRLIERKGIAGFSEDAGRVLAGFVYSNARLTSQNLHQGAITQATQEIPKDAGQLKDMAVKLTDYVRNPQEEAQQIRGLLFAQYLGGSLASAMVNMTQPFAVTMPYLSQWGGVAKSAIRMKGALADALKASTGDAKLDAALKKAEADGIVAPQEVHQLIAQARGQSALKSSDGTTTGDAKALLSNGFSKLTILWGKPFALAELFNRRVTFVAAYRTAVEQGIADPAGFAAKAIADTQFVYNKGNKPQWARGAVGSLAFTFKQYSISYMELLHRMATQGGPEGKKAAAFALAMLFLMSGAGGIPFMSDAEDVVDAIAQRLGYSFSTKQARRQFLISTLGEGAGAFVERGVSGLPGAPIDVAGRLGMGNLIPATGLLPKKQDHARDVAELAGPAADLAQRVFEGAGKVLDGDVVAGATMMAPKAAENLRKGLEVMIEGEYKDARGRKVIDAGVLDGLVKAIGFQPNDVAKVQEATVATQGLVAQNRMAKQDFAADMAKAVYERDAEAQKAVRDAVREWNRKNPHSPLNIDMAGVRRRVMAMRQSKTERVAQAAPKAIRQEVKRQLKESE